MCQLEPRKLVGSDIVRDWPSIFARSGCVQKKASEKERRNVGSLPKRLRRPDSRRDRARWSLLSSRLVSVVTSLEGDKVGFIRLTPQCESPPLVNLAEQNSQESRQESLCARLFILFLSLSSSLGSVRHRLWLRDHSPSLRSPWLLLATVTINFIVTDPERCGSKQGARWVQIQTNLDRRATGCSAFETS